MGETAILRSEISEIKKIYENIEISVSAERKEDLKRLEPDRKVMANLIDKPVTRADLSAKKRGKDRNALSYKFYVLAYSLTMFLEVFLCLTSLMLMKIRLKPIYRPKVIKKIQEADLVVFSGGEGIKEGSYFTPYDTYIKRNSLLLLYHKVFWWLFLFPKLCTIYIVRRILKKPIVVFPSTVGPFRTILGRFMAKTIFRNVDVLLIRENKSSAILKDMEIPHITTADVALLFDACYMHAKPIRLPARPLVGISPGLWDYSFSDDQKQRYISAHSKLLDHLATELGFSVVCVPSCLPGLKHGDLEMCKLIVRNMTDKRSVSFPKVRTIDEFRRVLGQLDLLITTRMHPSILACIDSVPFVTVIYDHKQTGFLEYLGLENCSVEVNNVSYNNLLSRTEFVWSNREKIKKQLALRVPALQNDVRTKIKLAILKFMK